MSYWKGVFPTSSYHHGINFCIHQLNNRKLTKYNPTNNESTHKKLIHIHKRLFKNAASVPSNIGIFYIVHLFLSEHV